MTDAKLRYVKISITEILEGIEDLSWEQRGFYLTALFKMYARMGGLPADDRQGASAMRCDVRFFRRMRDRLIACGKFFTEDGQLKNRRAEREIEHYVCEYNRRRDAAVTREESRRKQAETKPLPPELRPDFSRTSPRSPTEVPEILCGLNAKKSTKTTSDRPEIRPQDFVNHKPVKKEVSKKERKKDNNNPPLPPHGGSGCGVGFEVDSKPTVDSAVAQAAFDEWQVFARAHGLPCPLDKSFKNHAKPIVARLRQYATEPTERAMLDVWRQALGHCARSRFLRGMETKFMADLTMILRPDNFAKLLSGAYRNGASPADDRWALSAASAATEPSDHERNLAQARAEFLAEARARDREDRIRG